MGIALALGEGTGGRVARAAEGAAIVEGCWRATPAHDSFWLRRSCFGIGGSGLGMIGHRPLVRGVRCAKIGGS